jgi:uncharacterized small protein (DUF1192 family)
MSEDIEDIVAMARAAQRDERLADGPLYAKLADEIERLRAENATLKSTDMAVAMTEMSLRDEIERLRARVEVLEKVRAAAQALDGYGFGWLHWDEKFETLRAALKEAKP